MCDQEQIIGVGTRDNMTTHDLRAAAITFLLEANHSDVSVSMRSGRRNPKSIKSYSNLRGNLGPRYFRDVYCEPSVAENSPKTETDALIDLVVTTEHAKRDEDCVIPIEKSGPDCDAPAPKRHYNTDRSKAMMIANSQNKENCENQKCDIGNAGTKGNHSGSLLGSSISSGHVTDVYNTSYHYHNE